MFLFSEGGMTVTPPQFSLESCKWEDVQTPNHLNTLNIFSNFVLISGGFLAEEKTQGRW